MSPEKFELPAKILIWFSLCFFMFASVLLFFTVFFASTPAIWDLKGFVNRLFSAVKIDNTSSGLSSSVNQKAPLLPDYTSQVVGGGHNQLEMCEPQLDFYKKQYPGFDISINSMSEDTYRDFIGRVTYRYHCSYLARPKK